MPAWWGRSWQPGLKKVYEIVWIPEALSRKRWDSTKFVFHQFFNPTVEYASNIKIIVQYLKLQIEFQWQHFKKKLIASAAQTHQTNLEHLVARGFHKQTSTNQKSLQEKYPIITSIWIINYRSFYGKKIMLQHKVLWGYLRLFDSSTSVDWKKLLCPVQ